MSEGLVPWWPSCARSNLLIYWVPLSSCPREHFSRGHSQPSTASNLLWSPTLFSRLFVVLLPSLTASEYWKKKNGRKSASDQANHEEPIDASPWLSAIQYGACINDKKICLYVIFMQTNNRTISVYSSVPWQTVGTNNRLCQPNLSVLSFFILCFLNHVKHDKVNYWII